MKPFADVLPVRVVEMFGPAEAAPAVVALPPIPADQPHLNKWTADLRRRLAEEGAATKPLRLEVVLANTPPDADLEWRKPLAAVGAAIEGRVGTVVTVTVPQGSKAADLAALPDVSSVRLPRAVRADHRRSACGTKRPSRRRGRNPGQLPGGADATGPGRRKPTPSR